MESCPVFLGRKTYSHRFSPYQGILQNPYENLSSFFPPRKEKAYPKTLWDFTGPQIADPTLEVRVLHVF